MIRRPSIRGTRKTAAVLAALALTASLAACSGANTASSTSTSTQSAALSGTLTVYAAASLQTTFTQLGTEFQKEHPGTKVQFSFGGSSTLVTQIQQGAPADVFASADTANMDKLTTGKLVEGTPTIFATNVLTIAVPPSNPGNIHSFADLAKPGVTVVVCAVGVPCGTAAAADEKTAGITLKPVSEESSVTGVLSKITSGAADAGLIYVTDAKAAGSKVLSVPLDLKNATVNSYPIATVTGTKHQALADAFMALITGAQGQKTLAAAGFGAP